jgi:hypothetical protein
MPLFQRSPRTCLTLLAGELEYQPPPAMGRRTTLWTMTPRASLLCACLVVSCEYIKGAA